MPFCQNCGSEVNEGAKFCPECGHKQGDAPVTEAVASPTEPAPGAQPKPKKKRSRLLPITLAILALLACVGVWLTLGGSSRRPIGTTERLSAWTRRGRGDSMLDVSPISGKGYRQAKVKHDGKSNFQVTSYRGDQYIDLMIDEIGGYHGILRWDERADTLEIKADGAWEIVVSP